MSRSVEYVVAQVEASDDTKWETVVTAFAADMRVSGKAERTVGGHEAELRRYGKWLSENSIEWQRVTARQLKQLVRTRQHLSASSRASLICSLRVFYAWCVEDHYLAASPAATLKTPTRPKATPKALSLGHVRLLLSTLHNQRDGTLREKRDRALLLTGLYSGLRAAELAALKWSDIDIRGKSITVRLGKMQKGRTVKLHPDLGPILARWKEDQRGRDNETAFSVNRDPIVAGRVGKVARRYANSLGIPLTAHTLRHTFATWSLRRSGNIYAVSKALGHSQVRQTETYLRNDDSDSQAAVDALPGTGDW